MQCSGVSKSRKSLHPLRPHGSDSDMANMSLDILCKSPHGSRTSPQDKCDLLAARRADSKCCANADMVEMQCSLALVPLASASSTVEASSPVGSSVGRVLDEVLVVVGLLAFSRWFQSETEESF